MKLKQLILTLLFTLLTVNIWADDAKIIVWFNDANTANVEIPFEEMPTFTYDANNGNVTITAGTINYTWALADLKEFTFEKSLPTYIFIDTEDNSLAVQEKNAAKCNIKLERTLQTGGWNTLAVPFDMSADMLKSAFGDGTKLKELTGSSLTGNKLTLTFADATAIEAGKPYLVSVPAEVKNPTFSDVTLSQTSLPATTTYVDFIPAFGKSLVTGPTGDESNNWSVMFLGANNRFYHPTVVNQPDNDASYMKGFRAYFRLHNGAANAIEFTSNIDSEATAIQSVGTEESRMEHDVWYDLNGRKVSAASHLKKGVYVKNGKKIVIK
jgi:hypothetical protein